MMIAKDQMKMFNNIHFMGHEQIVFCNDEETGLKAIIAIHDTTLGPALGGTRMWDYVDHYEALQDVLRLSRGMSFKAAISGLELGGGKAVIIGGSNKKTIPLIQKFGEFVESLNGKYITAKDVGMTTKEMEIIHQKTKHVTGIPESMGGSGDPSPVTAYGVYMGMKASAKYKWGNDSLKGRKILVQGGAGHVGQCLINYLIQEDAELIINDINQEELENIVRKYNVKKAIGDDIYDLNIDIYSPCALGATLNPSTISRLKCEIVAGAANNQLSDENRDSVLLSKEGILYAPDFLINAGGLINVYSEIKGYDKETAMMKASNIYDTTLKILEQSHSNNITTHVAALQLAEKIISDKKAVVTSNYA
jgi:leucine dehydrogenase